MLRLLSLLQTGREWTGHELAARLEVSARTVRRDIGRLRELGYPVEATLGAVGGYRLEAGTAMPPLLLDDEEAVAVAVSLRTAAGGAVSLAGAEETSVRALAKLEQVLPSRLRNRVRALQEATVPLTGLGAEQRRFGLPPAGPLADPTTLSVLAAACRRGERVRFGYRAKDGTATRRHVEPHRLVNADRRWYLVAYDTERADWRSFRVDRVEDTPHATGVRVPPRELPTGDAAVYVSESITSHRARWSALVTLYVPAAEAERILPPGTGDVEPLDDTSCLLHTGSDALDWLAVRIALLGVEFEIREPAELRDWLREFGARITRSADRPPRAGPPADPPAPPPPP